MQTEEKGYNPNKDEKGFNSFYDEFHFLLGKIIVKFNFMEFQIFTMICNLLDPDNILIGFKACRNKSIARLIKLLSQLINEKVSDKETIRKFNELLIDLRKIKELRNTYMHSFYVDSSNLNITLNRSITTLSRIGISQFGRGKKSIQSTLIYELTPLRAISQWLDSANDEIIKFVHLLSKDFTIKQIKLSFPEEPDFLKRKVVNG